MKDLKSFCLILISTFLVGMMIFYYSIGINAMTGIKDKVTSIDITIPKPNPDVKYGYVNTDTKIRIPNAEEGFTQYAQDLLDSITMQISGMTIKDMEKEIKNIPMG